MRPAGMILTCPECATRYQTDASLFTLEGRKVRCAKCGHVWFQAPPQPGPEIAEAAVEPDIEDVAEAPAQHSAFAPSIADDGFAPAASPLDTTSAPRQWGEVATLAVGWAALALIVAAIGWSVVRYRQDIATLWPQTASLYRVMGLAVNTRGLAFQDKSAHYEIQGGQDVLVITGRLVNITSHDLTVPPIRIALIDADRRELYHWSVTPNPGMLGPGQAMPFQTRLPSPPPAARDIELRFAETKN